MTNLNPQPSAESNESLRRHGESAALASAQRGRLEMALAIILSLATLASTWCGYQAGLWTREQSDKQAAAEIAGRNASENTIVGLQLRTFDGLQILAYWDALRQNDATTSEGLYARMRPELRKALDASIADGALANPQAAGPLQRPEYLLKEEEDAKGLRKQAGQLQSQAQQSGDAARSYISLTLMFASVLFFGGIAGTFSTRRARVALGWISLALFAVSLTFLFRLPVFNF